MESIKVLVIDDSLFFRELLQKGLKPVNDISVIGSAVDPFEAKDKIVALKPDVITLDIEMPRMDGIKFLRKLLPQYPIPVIIISSLRESVFEAMNAGAIDFVPKPLELNTEHPEFIDEVAEKIKIAAKAGFAFRKPPKNSIELEVEGMDTAIDPHSIVAIGASTGGTEAIFSILTKFSAKMPGFVVVQHMPAGFTQLYADRLNANCELEVVEAKDGEPVGPGKVVIAPGDHQMKLKKIIGAGYHVTLDRSEKVNGHRPSVDVLFSSVADTAGEKAIGVILTGMGSDGALGLKKIRDKKGYTIGQDERSSVVYGMPMAAYLSGAVTVQLPLYHIPDEILRKLNK